MNEKFKNVVVPLGRILVGKEMQKPAYTLPKYIIPFVEFKKNRQTAYYYIIILNTI